MIDYNFIGVEHNWEIFDSFTRILNLIDKPVLSLDELNTYQYELVTQNNFGNVNAFYYLFNKNVEEYRNFIVKYFENLEINLIYPLEKKYFNNPDKVLYHASPLLNLEFILGKGGLLTDLATEGEKIIYFSERLYFSMAVSSFWQSIEKEFVFGTCLIVPDLKKYKKHKKLTVKINGQEDCFLTNECNDNLELSKDDIEKISSLKKSSKGLGEKFECHDNNYEIFINDNLSIDDIKRIYLISPEDELIRIYNNLGNKQFQVIDTEIFSQILKGKGKEVDKFKILGVDEETKKTILFNEAQVKYNESYAKFKETRDLKYFDELEYYLKQMKELTGIK